MKRKACDSRKKINDKTEFNRVSKELKNTINRTKSAAFNCESIYLTIVYNKITTFTKMCRK